nr:variable surface lipoprotein [Mycoplasmopsis bovis]
MKKSKFLLLGSVASLASIPFVALNVVKPKKKKEPEGDQNQSKVQARLNPVKVHRLTPVTRYTTENSR